MILYLARNESVSLLDRAAGEKSLHIRKLSGNFSLSEFIIRDMRKFESCRYFCVERLAVAEKDSEFIEALQSFQMMYDARIIVIHEGAGETDALTRELVRIGVTDLITATDTDEKLAQIAECLSDTGMQRPIKNLTFDTKPETVRISEETDWETDENEEKETVADSILQKQLRLLEETEDEQYRFDCLNLHIGVIGATRRVGTTTVALGLANFIRNHGGTVCYAAFNMNRHLESIAEAYGFDAEEDYYTYNAIDFYESMLPKYNYNFIVSDFGDIYNGEIRREAVKRYKECGVHLLCGANSKRHEVVEFAEALKAVRSARPQILTSPLNPEYRELFHSTVTKEPVTVKPVRDMLDFKANAPAFKDIIEKYIVETSKKL